MKMFTQNTLRILGLLIASALPSSGATRIWTGASAVSGYWATPANWPA